MPSLLTVRQHDVFAVTDTHTQALLERMNPISSAVHPDKHTLKVYMVTCQSWCNRLTDPSRVIQLSGLH